MTISWNGKGGMYFCGFPLSRIYFQWPDFMVKLVRLKPSRIGASKMKFIGRTEELKKNQSESEGRSFFIDADLWATQNRQKRTCETGLEGK